MGDCRDGEARALAGLLADILGVAWIRKTCGNAAHHLPLYALHLQKSKGMAQRRTGQARVGNETPLGWLNFLTSLGLLG